MLFAGISCLIITAVSLFALGQLVGEEKQGGMSNFPLKLASIFFVIVATPLGIGLIKAHTTDAYSGTLASKEFLLKRGAQVYQVLYQEKNGGSSYLAIIQPVGSDKPLLISSDEGLPTPEFMVFTLNGKTEILPSKDGKATISLPLTENIATPPPAQK